MDKEERSYASDFVVGFLTLFGLFTGIWILAVTIPGLAFLLLHGVVL